MEKSKRVAVMPVDFKWADVGNWTSLKRLLPQDERGNAQRGEVLLLDCKDNLIIVKGKA